MNSGKCFPSPVGSAEKVEKPKAICTCDTQRKPKRNVEQIIADKQLKEIFRRELKKDIFKLCDDLEQYGIDKVDSRKTQSARTAMKKGHFLPPIKRHYVSRKGLTSSMGLHDWRRLQTQSQYSEEDDRGFGLGMGGESGEGEGDGDDFDKRGRSQMRRGFGLGMGGEGGEGGDGDDFDKRGRSQMRRGFGLGMGGEGGEGGEGGDGDDFDKRSRQGRLTRFRRGKYGTRSGTSSPYSDSNMEMSTDFGYYGEGEDKGEDEFEYAYSLAESEMWDRREEYLLKYYQLKKLAEKLQTRADEVESKRVKGNNDYEEGYKFGFTEGHKKAYFTKPIYVSAAEKVTEEDLPYEEGTVLEDAMHNCYALILSKDDISKSIYISTKQEQIEELREIFKDVDIKMIRDREFSNETEKLVAEKIEELINCYKQTLLTENSPEYKEGFVDGFYDAFYQTFIFNPTEEKIKDDEKLFVCEVRKCILYDYDDINYDRKALLARAQNLKDAFKGTLDFDEYERRMDRMSLHKSLTFTKSDFLFFYNCRKKRRSKRAKRLSKSRGRLQTRPLYTGTTIDTDSRMKKKHVGRNNDRAWDYMNRHKIEDIFRYMGIMLCSYKPDDPIDFLINLLDKCLLFRINELRFKAPLVFTEKHVESIYSNMDPFNYGYIDGSQYLYGLNLLEVSEAEDEAFVSNMESVDKDQFLMNANNRLLEKFKNMIAVYYEDL